MSAPTDEVARGWSTARLGRFAWRHAAYALLAPLLMVASTAIHEGAHALAGLMLGAQLTEFVVLPTTRAGRVVWGHVTFEGAVPHAWLMIIAPAIVWAVIAGLTALAAHRVRPAALGKTVFLLGAVVPMIDICNQTAALLTGDSLADHGRVFAEHRALGIALGALYLGGAAALAWIAFVRRFSRAALAPAEFGLSCAGVIALVVIGPRLL